jgi:hypothetical protein
VAELNSQERRTEPPDGDLPLAVRQRLHRQVPFALPVIAIVPVVIAVVLATTLAPARAGAARTSGRREAPCRCWCRMPAW